MENCKVISTLMSLSTYVDQDESGTQVDITKYLGMIKSLLYLTSSHPGVMFSACLCACYL